jgi:hypothetical protein
VWGGRAKALVAAQRYRDQLLRRIDPDTRVRRRAPKGSRSVTGIVGVSLEQHVVGGRTYQRYVANWQDPERGLQRRRFLSEHYGKERALALAIEAREAGVEHNRAWCLGASKGRGYAPSSARATSASPGEGPAEPQRHQHGDETYAEASQPVIGRARRRTLC